MITLKRTMLAEMEREADRDIEIDNFGAYEANTEGDEGYYILKFTGKAYPLATDHDGVEGAPENKITEAGSLVVKGVYWNPVGGAAQWHTPTPPRQAQERIFLVRFLVSAKRRHGGPFRHCQAAQCL